MSILLDTPRCAKTAAPNLLDPLPIVLGLRETLARHGWLTLQVAGLPDPYGAHPAGRTRLVTAVIVGLAVAVLLDLHRVAGTAGGAQVLDDAIRRLERRGVRGALLLLRCAGTTTARL